MLTYRSRVVLILVNFSERNLCPMNVCDTCDDRSRAELSKNALYKYYDAILYQGILTVPCCCRRPRVDLYRVVVAAGYL
jgi:hypothetical protein